MAKALTAKSVERAKPGVNSKGEATTREIPDGLVRGLYLVVYASSAKGWCVRYRHGGKPRKLTLDAFLSLADARDAATDALKAAARGGDPAKDKRDAKAAARDGAEADRNRFSHVVAEFQKRHASKNRSAGETARLFAKEVLPAWSERSIREISKRDVIELLDGIADRGRGITANRTFSAIRRLFNWCIERDILTTSPCAGLKPPAAEISRNRVLSDGEIRWLWKSTEALGWPFGPAIRLLLVTAQREEEVGGLGSGLN